MPRFFEDFPVGFSEVYGPVTVTREAMVAFAREYDPQPFHVDEEAAKGTFVGTLIASGWHTCAINMRLVADGFLLDGASMGAPGVDELKWLRPVLPGDTLRTRATVKDARPSRSRPAIGLLLFAFEVLNQKDEAVMTQSNWIMFGRQGHPWPPAPGEAPRARGEAPEAIPERLREGLPPYLDELAPGDTNELGSYTFSPGDIIGFARQYDPQPFHTDPEAARHSLFGGLCASGWHTAAVWMRLMIATRGRIQAEAERQGYRPPRLGPSPGFRNLRWSKPVYAGDTVTYRSTITGARPSATRPGWGMAFHRNTGVNQDGDEVFSFDGAVFWERRPERDEELQEISPRSIDQP